MQAGSRIDAMRVWEKTASAQCSIDARTRSCFSFLREICSDTSTLLPDLESSIVAYLGAVDGRPVTLAARPGSVCRMARKGRGIFELCKQVVSIAASNTC